MAQKIKHKTKYKPHITLNFHCLSTTMSTTENTTSTTNDNIASLEDRQILAPKRLRECQLYSNEENLNKTPRLAEYESPYRIVQLIGKRFEKETQQIKALISESESRLLTVLDKSMSDFRRDMSKLTDRLINLTDRVENVETVANKIDAMKNDIELMKTEINDLKIQKLKQDNMQVACDLRINGIPSEDGENLYQMFDSLCETININTPQVRSIYRIKNVRDNRNISDAAILVNLRSPYDKNFILKNIALFRKSNKCSLQLRHIGFDSGKPFYVNENLTSYNYKIFQNAMKLKRHKRIESVFTNRGLIYVRCSKAETPILIENSEQLSVFFRDLPEQNNSYNQHPEQNNNSNLY